MKSIRLLHTSLLGLLGGILGWSLLQSGFNLFDALYTKVFPGLVKPTLLSPVIDLYINKNYKNNQIIPYYKSKGLFRDSMVNSNTRPSAIKLAGFINEMYDSADSSVFSDTGVSPLTIDY